MQEKTNVAERESLETTLSKLLSTRFAEVFPDCPEAAVAGRVTASANPAFGDFQCNDAMPLAKALKIPPRAVAEKIVSGFAAPDVIAKLEIAGPGFINITLADSFVAQRAEFVANDKLNGVPQSGAGRKIVIDYSSPNVAKPMHIGHIRSTVIGSAIDMLHRAIGYEVFADNHIGDWGTQFGIIIMGYRNFIDKERLAESPASELERVYVQSYAKTKEDENWLAQCRNELVKLQQGDPENRALWQEFIRLSLAEFDRVYKRLGVKFDMTRGESFYQDALAGVVERLDKLGLSKIDEGATIVDLESDNLGVAIVRKSDGGFNYTSTDIATVDSRVKEFAPENIIYVTDERQQLHFKQFFAICRKAGIAPESTSLSHVWFGLMRLPEGTFSTRQGNVIKLEALLDEAVRRALEIIKVSNADMMEEEQQKLAEAIGIGAIKYADLSHDPQTLIVFTWEKALALEGNSGPYLQYAYARVCSLLDKYAAQVPGTDPLTNALLLDEPVEKELALRLMQFPATVLRAAEAYKPSILADYLFGLSQTYSSFYQRSPVLKAEPAVRDSRIRLCAMVAQVLAEGLGLLGIRTPRRI